MEKFLTEKIEVEQSASSPHPVSFTWRGEVYTVAEVVEEWVDTGFGTANERSRVWFNRRHRRWFVVRTTADELFEMYKDYADNRKFTWWLTKKLERHG